MKKENTLSKALVGKFELVGYAPGVIISGGVKYDTRKMSVKEANEAIKAGITFLKKKEKETKGSSE